ncbi:MAG: helix-turn-helix domain-containing protein, partial [Candidatus Omnitrophica bacterium]|nr:helix-turn-helix domain-containing protein [Candidatus Omnitrophota bacterium]
NIFIDWIKEERYLDHPQIRLAHTAIDHLAIQRLQWLEQIRVAGRVSRSQFLRQIGISFANYSRLLEGTSVVTRDVYQWARERVLSLVVVVLEERLHQSGLNIFDVRDKVKEMTPLSVGQVINRDIFNLFSGERFPRDPAVLSAVHAAIDELVEPRVDRSAMVDSLRALREAGRVEQQAVAEAAGTSKTHLSTIEAHKAGLSSQMFATIHDATHNLIRERIDERLKLYHLESRRIIDDLQARDSHPTIDEITLISVLNGKAVIQDPAILKAIHEVIDQLRLEEIERLRRLREAGRLSLEKVGQHREVSATHFRDMERGDAYFTDQMFVVYQETICQLVAASLRERLDAYQLEAADVAVAVNIIRRKIDATIAEIDLDTIRQLAIRVDRFSDPVLFESVHVAIDRLPGQQLQNLRMAFGIGQRNYYERAWQQSYLSRIERGLELPSPARMAEIFAETIRLGGIRLKAAMESKNLAIAELSQETARRLEQDPRVIQSALELLVEKAVSEIYRTALTAMMTTVFIVIKEKKKPFLNYHLPYSLLPISSDAHEEAKRFSDGKERRIEDVAGFWGREGAGVINAAESMRPEWANVLNRILRFLHARVFLTEAQMRRIGYFQFVVTTDPAQLQDGDSNDDRFYVASVDFSKQIIYLHPSFFELGVEQQIVIYHELISHLAKGIFIEEEALEDTEQFAAVLAAMPMVPSTSEVYQKLVDAAPQAIDGSSGISSHRTSSVKKLMHVLLVILLVLIMMGLSNTALFFIYSFVFMIFV